MNGLLSRLKQIRWLRLGLFGIVGGLAGFLYYTYIGCYSGSCPITSDPYISTSYGMVIGLVLSLDVRKEKTDA
jgi:hypothetical protein